MLSQKQCKTTNKERPLTKVAPPAVFIVSLLLGIIIDYLYSSQFISCYINVWLGIPVLLLGISLHLYSIRTLKKAGTTFHANKAATKLVWNGPYRYSRNPIYLGMVIIYMGISLLINNAWLFLLLIPVFITLHVFVIKPEEAHLHRTFGNKYSDYCREVRRWI